jgi:hypothetical protein
MSNSEEHKLKRLNRARQKQKDNDQHRNFQNKKSKKVGLLG